MHIVTNINLVAANHGAYRPDAACGSLCTTLLRDRVKRRRDISTEASEKPWATVNAHQQ